MANVKDMKKRFCDDGYTDPQYVKERIVTLRDKLARSYGAESSFFGLSERHLGELVDQIDWQLRILSHACPYEWKGSAEYEENSVLVVPAKKFPIDLSGGYVGVGDQKPGHRPVNTFPPAVAPCRGRQAAFSCCV